MIGAVIGVGPRTGTSYVMKRLFEAGFAVYWEEDEWPDSDRQGGHFETPRERLPVIENRIVKVWPGAHRDTLIERAVLLHRPHAEQVAAIRRQIEREGGCEFTPEDIVKNCYRALEDLRASRLMAVQTGEIDDRLDEIFDFFREGLVYASCSHRGSRYRNRGHWC